MEKVISYIKLCRVKQWIKNGFVLCALIFSGYYLKLYYFRDTLLAVLAFCLISSFVYIMNDIKDVEGDRAHPKKCKRPIASGAVSKKEAIIIDFILLLSSLMISFAVSEKLLIIIVIYGVINVLYTFKLKEMIIIDVMCISAGFILRLAAGAVAIEVGLSRWIIICTGVLSLYLAFGKRRNELSILQNGGGEHRKTLKDYDGDYLDRVVLMMLVLTIMSYILYCTNGTNNEKMMITIPFVIYGTLRYEYLASVKGKGGAPEEMFFQDKAFLVDIILWLGVSLWAVAS